MDLEFDHKCGICVDSYSTFVIIYYCEKDIKLSLLFKKCLATFYLFIGV